MLLINQCLDKLHLYQVEKASLGLLNQPLLPPDLDPIDPLPNPDLPHHEDDLHDDLELGEVEADDGERQNGRVELAKSPGVYTSTIMLFWVL
jgi:hypothetical protein